MQHIMSKLILLKWIEGIFHTVVVKEKPIIEKQCSWQRNIDNCMRETKTENGIKYLVGETFGAMLPEVGSGAI